MHARVWHGSACFPANAHLPLPGTAGEGVTGLSIAAHANRPAGGAAHIAVSEPSVGMRLESPTQNLAGDVAACGGGGWDGERRMASGGDIKSGGGGLGGGKKFGEHGGGRGRFWSDEEHSRFLHAIKIYGYGNAHDIAAYVRTPLSGFCVCL